MAEEDYTERRGRILNGNIIKTLFTLAWPIMVGNVLQTAYNLVDTFWLGKVSKEAVAAPTVSWPIIFLIISIGFGLATAGVSLVSQHTGAGSKERANKAAGQVFSILLLLSFAMGIVGFIGSGWILTDIIGAPTEVVPMAASYLKIIFAGLPLMFGFIAFNFLLRGVGDMKRPMYILGIGVIINVVLDPFLILGIGPFPQMLVSGAAAATVLTRGVSSAIGIYILFSNRADISLNLGVLKPDFGWLKKILDIGLPTAIARGGSALGFVAVMTLVTKFGTVPVTAYGIGQRVIQVVNIGIWGFAGSALTMVGQNIGAENKDRAGKIVYRTLLTSGLIMFAISIALFLFRGEIIGVFIDNKSVIETGSQFIAIFVFSLPFFGFFRIFDSTYRGSGHTKPALTLSFTRIWILRVGLCYFLAFGVSGVGMGMGVTGLWWGMALGNIIGAGLSYLYFLTGRWKSKTIEDSESLQPQNLE